MNDELELSPSAPFFARVKPQFWARYLPETFGPILAYLAEAHGLRVREIYLDNVKSPTNEIFLDGILPLEELARRFPPTERLGYVAGAVVDRVAQASLNSRAAWTGTEMDQKF